MKYHYFASFTCVNSKGLTDGDMSFVKNKKIITHEDIEDIRQHAIKTMELKRLTFLNITLLHKKLW